MRLSSFPKVYVTCIIFHSLVSSSSGLTVSTLNIWNRMFNWHVRKHRIVEMITSAQTDVLALQEVRSGTGGSQLLELKSQLPSEYKWHIFHRANNVSLHVDSVDHQFNEEGIGLISRVPIKASSVGYLIPSALDPDKNKRLIVHATVQDTSGLLYNIIVVHLSYHRQQQCRNVAEILTFIKRKGLKNLILLGDFNTYNDYEWPIKMLTEGPKGKGRGNRCYRTMAQSDIEIDEVFTDAWPATHPDAAGLTFSNMPSPGMESRPDRILLSSSLSVHSTQLLGNGSRYKQRYTASIHWERFISIIKAAKLSYDGVSGYSCTQDCGPSGSCQCAVCVAVGNKKDCNLPDCDVCGAELYTRLVRYSIVSVIILFHVFYAIITVLTVGAGSYGNTMYSILGFNCCLLNPDLCKKNVFSFRRKYKWARLLQAWPLFQLPPYIQLVFSILLLAGFYIYVRNKLGAVITLAYNTLEEEFFPSDHLMLTANIT